MGTEPKPKSPRDRDGPRRCRQRATCCLREGDLRPARHLRSEMPVLQRSVPTSIARRTAARYLFVERILHSGAPVPGFVSTSRTASTPVARRLVTTERASSAVSRESDSPNEILRHETWSNPSADIQLSATPPKANSKMARPLSQPAVRPMARPGINTAVQPKRFNSAERKPPAHRRRTRGRPVTPS